MNTNVTSILEGLHSLVNEAKEKTTYFRFNLINDGTELRMEDINGNYTVLNKDELEELYKVLGQYRKEIKK